MTITSGAGATGIEVNSAAKDSSGSASTLGSQTAALADEVIVPDAITVNNEGNLQASPSYIGRLLQIREIATGAATVIVNNAGSGYVVDEVITLTGGTAARQARLIVTSVSGGNITGIKIHEADDNGTPDVTVGFDRGEYSVEPSNPVAQGSSSASGTSATFDLTFKSVDEYRFVRADASNTLTVHEDWVDGPASGENWRICYIIQDVATALGLSLLNMRVSDYSSSRRLSVKSTGGWLAFLEGASLETVDFSSTVTSDFEIESGARFDSGYLAGGSPVSGAYIIGTPAVAGELVWQIFISTTSVVNLYDFFFTCVINNRMDLIGPFTSKGVKLFRPQTLLLASGAPVGPITQVLDDFRVEWDQGDALDVCQIRDETSFKDSIFIGAMIAHHYVNSHRAGGRNTQFVNNVIDVFEALHQLSTSFNSHEFINPTWDFDISVQEKLRFKGHAEGSTGFVLSNNVVIRSFELLISVTDNTGGALTDATVHVVEETVTDGIVSGTSTDGFPITTNENGEFMDDIWSIIYRDQIKSGGAAFGPDGTNGITTASGSPTATITRLDGGSFITDGFAVGNSVRISHSDADEVPIGTYTTTIVTAGVLTVEDLTNFLGSTTADLTLVVTEVDIDAETRGNFGFRAYKYGKQPFIRGLASLTENQFLPVSMIDDDEITEATQATAVTNGAGIVVERYPTPVRGPFDPQGLAEAASSTTIDLTFTVPSGLTDAVLVVTAAGNGNNNWPTGIDWGPGVDALTEVVNVGQSARGSGMWRLINPAVATRTIRVTFGVAATDRRIQAFYITQATQTSPEDQTAESNSFNPPNDSLDITPTLANSMAVFNYHSGEDDLLNINPIGKTADMRKVGSVVAGAAGVAEPLINWTKILPAIAVEKFWIQWPYLTGVAQTDAIAQVANFDPSGDTQPVKVINYDGGTGTVPTVGETITIDNAGADTTGVLHEFIGDEVSGTLVLTGWNGTAPENDVGITGSSSSFSATSHTSGGGSFDEEYTWLVDCDSKAMTVVYDYLLAKISESGQSLDSEFRDAIIWGEDEQSQLVYSAAGTYTTERNVNRAEGVWLSNRGAGTITYMTSDGGAQFVPPVEITVTFNTLKDNSEIWVFPTGVRGQGNEIAEIEDAISGSVDNRNFAWSAPASTVVDYFIHNWQPGVPVYETIEVIGFTVPLTDTVIDIAQRLNRNTE